MILKRNDTIHDIPNEDAYQQVLSILEEKGHPIHSVMRITNNFQSYPHVYNFGDFIDGSCAAPGDKSYTWISYEEFLIIVGIDMPPQADQKDSISEQFERKVKENLGI